MDLENRIICNGCHTKTKVVMWKCRCDKLWHRCPLHRDSSVSRAVANTELKTRKYTPAEAKGCKRSRITPVVGPDSHAWLLAEDEAREKRKRDFVDLYDQPTIVLGYSKGNTINPAFLGPSLKRRFVEVVSASAESK